MTDLQGNAGASGERRRPNVESIKLLDGIMVPSYYYSLIRQIL